MFFRKFVALKQVSTVKKSHEYQVGSVFASVLPLVGKLRWNSSQHRRSDNINYMEWFQIHPVYLNKSTLFRLDIFPDKWIEFVCKLRLKYLKNTKIMLT